MRREHKNGSFRHVLFGVDENGTTSFEVTGDVGVVDDLMTDVDRRSIHAHRALDRLDGAYYSRAEAARGSHDHFLHHVRSTKANRAEFGIAPIGRCASGMRSRWSRKWRMSANCPVTRYWTG